REHLDGRPDLADTGRTDEDAPQGLTVAVERQIGLEARDLAAIAVSVDLAVESAEVAAVEDDHSGAAPKYRPRELAHGLVEPVETHQPHERRRLASGDHEPVEALQLLRLANLHCVRAKAPQHRRVLAEISLHFQDSELDNVDFRFPSSRCPGTM